MSLDRKVTEFTNRHPIAAGIIGAIVICICFGVVGTLDFEDELRAAQPVVFRSV